MEQSFIARNSKYFYFKIYMEQSITAQRNNYIFYLEQFFVAQHKIYFHFQMNLELSFAAQLSICLFAFLIIWSSSLLLSNGFNMLFCNVSDAVLCS